jgi:hypothetical protein
LRAAVQAKYTPEWWSKANSEDIRSIEVDGKKIKPDTWYTAKNGKLVISE